MVTSGRQLDDDRPVTYKPPQHPSYSSSGVPPPLTPQKHPPMPHPPPQSRRVPETGREGDPKQSRGGKLPRGSETFADYPSTMLGETPLVPSAGIIANAQTNRAVMDSRVCTDDPIQSGNIAARVPAHINSYYPSPLVPYVEFSLKHQSSRNDPKQPRDTPAANVLDNRIRSDISSSNRSPEHPDKVQSHYSKQGKQVSSRRRHEDSKQPGDWSKHDSLQGSRYTAAEYSHMPQYGSSSSAPRHPSPIKDDGSVFSRHGPSSHFANVRSFSSNTDDDAAKMSATARADQCTNSTSQNNDPKQACDIAMTGPSISKIVPDYPNPAYGHTPLVPSAQFDTCSMATPPLHVPDPHSSYSPTSGHQVTKMHTPPLQRTGSDQRGRDHSTPVPGHALQAQQTFTLEEFANNEDSSMTSQIRGQLDGTSATGNNETSRWDADNTDA